MYIRLSRQVLRKSIFLKICQTNVHKRVGSCVLSRKFCRESGGLPATRFHSKYCLKKLRKFYHLFIIEKKQVFFLYIEFIRYI